MIRLLWVASVRTRYILRRYMPSNILLDGIRTRRGLRWGVPAMLLALPYLAIATWCGTLAEDGGPGWLNIIVLVSVWNAFKMLTIGPISLGLLAAVRIHERQARNGGESAAHSGTPAAEVLTAKGAYSPSAYGLVSNSSPRG